VRWFIVLIHLIKEEDADGEEIERARETEMVMELVRKKEMVRETDGDG
jgi:hypothetical protein